MNSHPNLVSSANWQSRDLHSSPVIFLRARGKSRQEVSRGIIVKESTDADTSPSLIISSELFGRS